MVPEITGNKQNTKPHKENLQQNWLPSKVRLNCNVQNSHKISWQSIPDMPKYLNWTYQSIQTSQHQVLRESLDELTFFPCIPT